MELEFLSFICPASRMNLTGFTDSLGRLRAINETDNYWGREKEREKEREREREREEETFWKTSTALSSFVFPKQHRQDTIIQHTFPMYANLIDSIFRFRGSMT
jgi:hypothetical protein